MLLNEFYNESPTKSKARMNIVSKAIGLFTDKGMEAISMVEIASKCNMTTRNLYRYYASKDYLVMDTGFVIMSGGTFGQIDIRDEPTNGISRLEEYLNQLYMAEINSKYGVKLFKYIMHFDLFVSKLSCENLALQRYISLYRDEIEDTGYIILTEILQQGIKDKSISIKEEDISFYVVFIMQSLFSVTSRVVIKQKENKSINADLIKKQIELIISHLN